MIFFIGIFDDMLQNSSKLILSILSMSSEMSSLKSKLKSVIISSLVESMIKK